MNARPPAGTGDHPTRRTLPAAMGRHASRAAAEPCFERLHYDDEIRPAIPQQCADAINAWALVVSRWSDFSSGNAEKSLRAGLVVRPSAVLLLVPRKQSRLVPSTPLGHYLTRPKNKSASQVNWHVPGPLGRPSNKVG